MTVNAVSTSRLFFAAAGLALWACGGPRGTCTIDTSSPAGYTYCTTYTGMEWGPNTVMSDCASASGTYSLLDCPKDLGGTCTFNGGTGTEKKQSYNLVSADGGSVDLRGVCSVAGGFYDPT